MPWFKKYIVVRNNNVDINDIHTTVIKLFKTQFLKKGEIKKKIKKYEEIINNGARSDKEKAKKIKKKLESRYLEIDSMAKFYEYLRRTSNYIVQYKAMNKNKKSWMKVVVKNSAKRSRLIHDYLKILEDYVILIDNSSIIYCPNCKKTIDEFETRCSFCKEKITQIKELPRDSKYIKGFSNSNYDPKDNFEEVLKRFQGKWKRKPSESDIEKVRTYIKTQHLSKTVPNRKEIHKALKILNMTKFYYDTNYIHHVITSEPMLDLEKYEDKLMKRHSIYKQYFAHLKPEKRRNSYRAHYLIFQFLCQENFNPPSSYFIGFETADAKLQCDEIHRKIFENIQKDYPFENWEFYHMD